MISYKSSESFSPPQPVQNFQISSMRNELVSMQKSIDKMKNEFEITISDIPPQLAQKLEIIRQKQKSIASLVDKERFKTYQSRFLDLQTQIDDLSKRVKNYVDVSNKRATDKRFEKAFSKLKDAVNSESVKIRNEISIRAMERIESFSKKAEKKSEIQKYEFHSSLELLPKDEMQQRYSNIYKDEIDNSILFVRLSKTGERIKKAESDMELYHKRKEWNTKKQMEQIDDELANAIEESHQNLLRYKTDYLNIRTDLSNRSKKRVVDIISDKTYEDKSQVVTNAEFLDWSTKINNTMEGVRGDIQEFENKANASLDTVQTKIDNLSNEITKVYERVVEIDKTMNDFNEQLGYQLEDKIQVQNDRKDINIEEVKEVFQEFRDNFQKVRIEMKKKIDQTKRELEEAEDKIQKEYTI